MSIPAINHVREIKENMEIHNKALPYCKQIDEIEVEALNDWDKTYVKFTSNELSAEQFEQWITQTHLPAWEKAQQLVEEVVKITDNASFATFLAETMKQRIEYCHDFQTALKEKSPEKLDKALRKMFRATLRVIKDKFDKQEAVPATQAPQFLVWAVLTNDQQTVQWLVDKGADINVPCANGMTAIQFAKTDNNDQMVEFLKSLGAKE